MPAIIFLTLPVRAQAGAGLVQVYLPPLRLFQCPLAVRGALRETTANFPWTLDAKRDVFGVPRSGRDCRMDPKFLDPDTLALHAGCSAT
jgi:hypothetical protein